MKELILKEIDNKFKTYKVENKEEFIKIVEPIISHEEFQKRFDNKQYPHHGNTSLGQHIISDAIMTYKLAQKKKCNVKLATLTAMFHDLYELPWQNSGRKESRFTNKHGFTHPLEATINAITWFPEYFDEDNYKVLIVGILHHMYPFPVRALNNIDAELNNKHKLETIDDLLKEYIIESSNRKRIGTISFSRSKYKEGRLVSLADKLITLRSDKLSPNACIALVTGRNKDLEK